MLGSSREMCYARTRVCILPGTLVGVCIKWHAKISANRLSVVTEEGDFSRISKIYRKKSSSRNSPTLIRF